MSIMNLKYSTTRHAIVALAAMLLLTTACRDDFGYQNVEGRPIALEVAAPEAWYGGMTVSENASTTHCTSVRALSVDGGPKLYLHTMVADNPAENHDVLTRGTPVNGTESFRKRYKRFSLSGICFTGTYPDDEATNTWTPEYAYDLYYNTTSGTPTEDGRQLLWPSNGHVRFYAFAPTVEDFDSLATGGSLILSDAKHKGSPTLTYTVPTDVTRQIDLMTVCKPVDAPTTPVVELKFGHALTAVQIRCGEDMLSGKITEVTIAGVHGTGTQVIGSDSWTTSGTATYTISKEITLPPNGESDPDGIHTPDGTPIAGTATDSLTLMLLPQKVPAGATMTIKFTDDVTGTERTLNGSIAGDTWAAGKIVTYSVSPSSIHINAKIEFNKKGSTIENPTGDTIPYTGVWYDVKYNAHAEITQDGVEGIHKLDIDADKVGFSYRVVDNANAEEDGWQRVKASDANGLLAIAPQPALSAMNANATHQFADGEKGTPESPFSLSDEYGETANCYLVDQAGYYSLALVYGNGNTNPVMSGGLNHFADHNDSQIGAPEITGASGAVLLWQDSPGLIDPNSVTVSNNNLVFHIRKHSLAQGNAVVAVRNNSGDILWSWHIWVTPHKYSFYNDDLCLLTTTINASSTKPEDKRTYKMPKNYNLGWCDSHGGDEERKLQLRAIIDMRYYGGPEDYAVDIPGEFIQTEFKESKGGDNTYYQWGRKDPMLGGIYNDKTPKYQFYGKGISTDVKDTEFTMENKPVFDTYKKDGYDYSFRKNPGDILAPTAYESTGVSIGYTIRHPYVFITNSRENGTTGWDGVKWTGKSYRNHWHKIDDSDLKLLGYVGTHTASGKELMNIMYNAWNSAATGTGYAIETENPGVTVSETVRSQREANAQKVTKTIYDPCPPKFKIPPIDAFRALAFKGSETFTTYNGAVTNNGNAWTITLSDGNSLKFPSTGVRDYALRTNEWNTVQKYGGGELSENDRKTLLATSMPAFKQLTFVSTATLSETQSSNSTDVLIDQVLIFILDNRNSKIRCGVKSSNSYGMAVRPIYDE